MGFDGGMAVLTPATHEAIPMPIIKTPKAKTKKTKKPGYKKVLDMHKISEYIKITSPDLVIIEFQHSMPKQSSQSGFVLGEQYGAIQGIVASSGFSYQIVRAQDWKKKVLIGYNQKDKSGAIMYVKRKYPNLNLLASSQCRKPHDGMVDAICIAEYGEQLFIKETK